VPQRSAVARAGVLTLEVARGCSSGRAVVAALLLGGACTAPNPAYRPSERDGAAGGTADAAVSPDIAAVLADVAAADSSPADLASAQPLCPSDSTLAVCLAFENAVSDESPSRLDATVTAVTFEAGPGGLAASLTDRSLIQLADSPVLASPAITIEAWVKPRSFPTGSTRSVLVDYSRQYALVMLAGGELRCRVNTGGSSFVELSSTSALKTGVWQSLACAVGNGSFTLWRQGAVLASVPISGPLVARSTTEPFLVGSNYPTSANPANDPFLGAIDNLRVWRRVRTAAEICAGAFDCPQP
jgi:hypothetical protein